MKNPKWERDEIILALDLYFKLEPKEMDAKNEKVIELSKTLNRLPIHKNKLLYQKFRNPNGVGLKLANFRAIDPNGGKGMHAYSKLDKIIFQEFFNDKEELKRIAKQIKNAIEDEKLNRELYRIPDEQEDEIEMVKEGRVIYKIHKYRERNSKITKKKKEQVLRKNPKKQCEVCGFDFEFTFGELGKEFIECHHKIPLHEYNSNSETNISDLALVCSNCHRMLHKGINTLSIEDLKKIRITAANKVQNKHTP